MERQRLLKLIENKGTFSKEETAELWDIVRTFPYFQTARLLLAKSFHNRESIHFHNELKAVAAYASDRKVLFNLINREKTKEKVNEENNVFAIEEKQKLEEEPVLKLTESHSVRRTPDSFGENLFVIAEKSEEQIEAPVSEIEEEVPSIPERKTDFITPVPKYIEEPEEKEEVIEVKVTAQEPSTSSSDEPSTTNEEIIRRRLSEILGRTKLEAQKPEEQKTDQGVNIEEQQAIIETPTIKKDEPVSDSILNELPSEPKDAIESLEIETIIEDNYLKELEKLPEITKAGASEIEQEKEIITTQASQSEIQVPSFIDWLKQKTAGETTLEELKDEPAHFHYEFEKESNKPARKSTELINKFIATEPRITPVKAEFYSASNMAKQSTIDNEEIISETLARIYFNQGNYQKARSCYEKLSLLYPEKSTTFAPLIEKIDNILNQM